MNQAITYKPKKGYIKSSTLIIFAFATAFFARVLSTVGFPSVINFVHFGAVTFAFLIALFSTKAKDRKQIVISQALLSGLLLLFITMTASALLNHAGIINIVVDFLLLGEPFMLLLAIMCIPMSAESIDKFRNWISGFALTNLLVAYVQWPLVYLGLLYRGSYGQTDAIQGVFYLSGAGNYVSASVSCCFAMYYFGRGKILPNWIRLSLLFAAFWQLLISDSKQVIMALIIGFLLMSFFELNNVKQTLIYVISSFVLIFGFLWCVENIEAFDAFKGWLDRSDLYGSDSPFVQTKGAVFPIIISYYKSSLNWLFGLGPGHTVGRLGGWMIKDYWDLLGPLGATKHPATAAVWDVVENSWIAHETTAAFPLFGWAGIWGDLGFVGLAAYLFLGFLVWQYFCLDGFSKFWVLATFVLGLIFTQMEEPSYMLFIASLIGLKWHEHKNKANI